MKHTTKMTFHLTQGNDELAEIMANNHGKLVLIDFYAKWCQPCKMIAPYLDELISTRPMVLIKVDVDEDGNTDIVQRFQVRAMPTFVWISNITTKRLEGANKAAVEAITNELLSA